MSAAAAINTKPVILAKRKPAKAKAVAKPKPIPGVEIRPRKRRATGEVYYVYRVRYKNARGIRAERTFDEPEEAIDFKAHLRLTERRGGLESLDTGSETLEEFMPTYWRLYAKRRLAKSTRKKNRGLWNRYLLPRLGPLEIRQVTPMLLSELVAEWEDEGVGMATIRSLLGMLQSMYQRAVEWGRATINVVKQIQKPSAPRQRAVIPLAPETVERIRAHMLTDPDHGLRDATLVSVLAYTGMRPEDALGLECEHFRESTVLIEQKWVEGEILPGQKTNAPPRSPQLLAALKSDVVTFMLAEGVRTGLLFRNTSGDVWGPCDYRNWRRRVWQPACEVVGIATITITKERVDGKLKTKRNYVGPVPYDLRHSFASLMIHEGKRSLPEIAEALGHGVDTLLRVYTHLIAEMANRPKEPAEAAIEAARALVHAQAA